MNKPVPPTVPIPPKQPAEFLPNPIKRIDVSDYSTDDIIEILYYAENIPVDQLHSYNVTYHMQHNSYINEEQLFLHVHRKEREIDPEYPAKMQEYETLRAKYDADMVEYEKQLDAFNIQNKAYCEWDNLRQRELKIGKLRFEIDLKQKELDALIPPEKQKEVRLQELKSSMAHYQNKIDSLQKVVEEIEKTD